MSDEKKNRVKVEDLPEPEKELTDEEAKDVQGGLGMLLPAVQKVRGDESVGTDGPAAGQQDEP